MEKISHHIQFENSDCTIVSNQQVAIDEAVLQLKADLSELNHFVKLQPEWKASYHPMVKTSNLQSNSVMQEMERVAKKCDVGPMAAVAGVLADRMKHKMLQQPKTKIAVVENGGEISIKSPEEIIIGLQVLSTSLQSKLGFKYLGDYGEMGVATSSATFGHAESLGTADAVVVFAPNAGLADAAATKICNAVIGRTSQEAVNIGLEAFAKIPELYGVFIVKDKLIGKTGKIPPLIRVNNDLKI